MKNELVKSSARLNYYPAKCSARLTVIQKRIQLGQKSKGRSDQLKLSSMVFGMLKTIQ